MPTSIQTTEDSGTQARWTFLVPVAFVVCVACLTLMLHGRFEDALEVLAPGMLAACVAVVAAAVIQLVLSTRRLHRRARTYPEIASALDALALGRSAEGALGIGDESHTLDATRAMVAARSPEEQRRIRRCLRTEEVWRPVARRAEPGQRKWHRVRALHDLGWLGAVDAAPVVYASLSDDDDDVAWSALVALGGIHDHTAFDVLVELLDDGRFPASRVAQVLDASTHPDALARLSARIPASPPQMLFWIAYLLGRCETADALEPLLELSANSSADVRASAAEGLGRLGEQDAYEALMRLMRDPEWFVRLHACRALGDLQAGQALDALRTAAHDRNWWVRRSALDAIDRIGGTAA